MWAEIWHDVRYRTRAVLRRRQLNRDLDAEIEAHIARETTALMRAGLPASEARRRARLDFGAVEDIRAQVRDARGIAVVESILLDVREALRALRARPSFAAAVSVALAVGIGGSTATFIATKTVLHDPLPYPDDERLVMIWAASAAEPGRRLLPTVPEFVAWRDKAKRFESMGTLGQAGSHLTDTPANPTDVPSEEITVEVWSASLLQTLRLTPLLGRVFTGAEDVPGAPAVALISEDLWERRFHRRPDIIGRTMGLDGVETEIIGVMATGISPMNPATDAWTPVSLEPERLAGSARGWPVVARLKPGVSVADAEAEADGIVARLGAESGSTEGLGSTVESFRESRYGTYARILGRFEVLSAGVFLAVCANVAGLLLMRAASRRRALAIRSAVGAGRSRLLRQFLVEALLLTTIGAFGSIGVAWLILETSSRVGPTPLPHAGATPFDLTALLFVGGGSLLAALLVIPPAAVHVMRVKPADSLPASRARATDAAGGRRLRTGLVTAQVALAMVLVIGVGLMGTTFLRIRSTDLGGDPSNVVTFTIRFPPVQYRTMVGVRDGRPLLRVSPAPALIAEELRTRLEQTDGVTSAAVATRLPFVGDYAPVAFTADHTAPASGVIRIVSPHYFETLDIAVAHGRAFTRSDTAAAPWVAIVNEAMARHLWDGTTALGRTIRMKHAPGEQPRAIVGVVGDTRPHPLATAVTPAIYLPLAQQPDNALSPRLAERLLMTFLVRTTDDPMDVVPDLRALAAGVDPTRTPDTFRRLEDAMTQPLAPRRQLLVILAAFAATALVLAATAIHGAVSDGMARDAREIGIRRAFGAGRADLWRLTAGRLIWLVVPGVAIGTVAAIALSPVMASLLFGISRTDLWTCAAAALAICAIAIVAASAPIRRVLAVSPHAALDAD